MYASQLQKVISFRYSYQYFQVRAQNRVCFGTSKGIPYQPQVVHCNTNDLIDFKQKNHYRTIRLHAADFKRTSPKLKAISNRPFTVISPILHLRVGILQCYYGIRYLCLHTVS